MMSRVMLNIRQQTHIAGPTSFTVSSEGDTALSFSHCNPPLSTVYSDEIQMRSVGTGQEGWEDEIRERPVPYVEGVSFPRPSNA